MTKKDNKKKTGNLKTEMFKAPELKRVIPAPPDEEDDNFKCVTCGRKYIRQSGNFSFSQSPLYNGNNYYLTTCNKCVDNLLFQYEDLLGSFERAVQRICLHFDIYFNDDILKSAINSGKNTEKSIIRSYIRTCNLTQHKGKTYDTFLRECENEKVKDYEKLEELKNNEKSKDIAKGTKKTWGLGYEDKEYIMLEEHYRAFRDKIGEDNDEVKDSLIKNLCEIHVLKYRARQDEKYDVYEKMTKLYQQTLLAAGFNAKDKNNDDSNNEDNCWGNFVKIIEEYSPADFFKDKHIFKDDNHLEDYCNRHIKRPTLNLVNNTKIQDTEYSLNEVDYD